MGSIFALKHLNLVLEARKTEATVRFQHQDELIAWLQIEMMANGFRKQQATVFAALLSFRLELYCKIQNTSASKAETLAKLEISPTYHPIPRRAVFAKFDSLLRD